DVRAFTHLNGWRRELLIEQRAHCLLMAGRVEQALVGFLRRLESCEQALDRGERWPDSDALHDPPDLLVAAAAGRLRELLGARVEALVTRMGDELLIEVLRSSDR
ncbi:MAG TPA: hypothetical protein VLU54_03935, partial [Casimicrobiaceae bacterium]|nr:hypothetical protein [Casimicrobiaceae bacterium]